MAGTTQDIPNQSIALLIVTTILMFLATVTIAARIICRVFLLRTAGLDDWCALGATVVAIGMVVTIGLAVKHGTGLQGPHADKDIALLSKLRLAIQLFYTVTSGLTKISILLLYRRIFPNLRTTAAVMICLITAMSMAFIFAMVFQCHPVRKLWSPVSERRSFCFPVLGFWCSVSSLFMASDVWIMVVPVRTVFSLQFSLRKKLTVLSLFCLGIFACAAAVARLVFVVRLYKGNYLSGNVVPLYLSTIIEVSLALVASSVPPLRPGVMMIIEYLHAKIPSEVEIGGDDNA